MKKSVVIGLVILGFMVLGCFQDKGKITGYVLDSSADPLADVQVVIEPGGHTAVTNTSGIYTTGDVPMGDYTVTATSGTATNSVTVTVKEQSAISCSPVKISAGDIQLNITDGGNYSLTVSINPSGAGAVDLNPAGGSYTSGTQVTMTATANSGYTFSNWSGDASGTNATTTVTVNSNKNVTANFNTTSDYTLTVTVNPSAAGSVTLNPAGGSYTSGTVVTLTATANSGYIFASWSGDATGTTSPTTVTMTGNKSVTANFNTTAGQIFSDNFNEWTTSLGPWDSANNVTGGSILSTSTVVSNTAPGSLYCKNDSAPMYTGPHLVKDLTAGSPRYIRFYIYLPSTFAAGPVYTQIYPLVVRSVTSRRYLFGIDTATLATWLEVDVSWDGSRNGTVLTRETWHRVEVLCPAIPSATAEVMWWIDGTEQTGFTTDLNDAGAGWGNISFGAADVNDVVDEEYYLDDFAVSDSPIGP